MNLENFFQLSGSIFFLVATIFMIILLIWAITLRIQISKLIKKFEEIAVEAKSATAEFHTFINRTINALEQFKNSILTFEFARKITAEIISLIKNKSEGGKNEQTN